MIDDERAQLLPEGDAGVRPMAGQEGTHIEEAHVLPLSGEIVPSLDACRTNVPLGDGWRTTVPEYADDDAEPPPLP